MLQNFWNGPYVVVQKHAARTLHFDFRLEKDGVYKSWAIPKGVPEEDGVRRLAIQSEDHDLGFGEFEGTISEGEYGGGKIEIWDSGAYELHHWSNDRIHFSLSGSRYTGTYQLVRFLRGGKRDCLLCCTRQSETNASSLDNSGEDITGDA